MAEEIARSLEGSDLKWMQEAALVMRTKPSKEPPFTVHYAIPADDLRSLVRAGLVSNGSLILTETGEAVARILKADHREEDSNA